MQASNMDPRSRKYLEENGIKNNIHNPKKISKKILNYFDYFIAVDSYVLNKLNKAYPKYRHKFFLATAHINNIYLVDPYKMNDEDYKDIMNKIKITSCDINLQFD